MMFKVDRYIDKQVSNFTAWLLQIRIKILLKIFLEKIYICYKNIAVMTKMLKEWNLYKSLM